MAVGGFYRSDGLQNSGTAIRYGNENAYIYNSSGQIYPREVSQTLDSNSFGGGFGCRTYRTVGGWRDCAYQGVKSVGYSSQIRICYGHITPNNIPRYKNLISVDYVKVRFKAHHCGWSSISRDLVFRVATDDNAIPNMKGEYRYSLGAGQDTSYQTAEAYSGGLTDLMYILLTEGKKLMLYNGETTLASPIYNDGTGYGSKNYAAIESFEIQEMRLKYRP